MRILVVGAGATGGYFGARLAQAGRDVTFLIKKNRLSELRITGLQVLSPHGDFTVKVPLVTSDELEGIFDVVLVAVKAYSLTAALEDFAPAVGPETLIVPILNGMRHFETLQARFGEDAVLGGLCRINTTVDYRGRIVQLNELHELWYGERNGRSSERAERLHTVLRDAGFVANLTQVIGSKLWEKWILLATLGGITCLMGGDIGEVARASGGVAFSLAFLEETRKIAAAAGFPPDQEFLDKARASLEQKDSAQTTSMYRDMMKGTAIEAEQIVGDLLAEAGRRGVETPLLAAAWVSLCVYQNRAGAAKA